MSLQSLILSTWKEMNQTADGLHQELESVIENGKLKVKDVTTDNASDQVKAKIYAGYPTLDVDIH